MSWSWTSFGVGIGVALAAVYWVLGVTVRRELRQPTKRELDEMLEKA